MNKNNNQNLIESLMNKYQSILKNYISGFRYAHSISVANCAMSLAMRYDIKLEDALVAGILHDIAKKNNNNEILDLCNKNNISLSEYDLKSIPVLHSYLGAYIARNELNITNEDILNSIYNHTLGRANMSNLEKIIFVADYIEPLRKNRSNMSYIRKMAFIDINKCIVLIIESSIDHLKKENIFIHPKMLETYEYYKNLNVEQV